ncbi:hypothetical protein FQZ97_492750 [compost metagenome]
MISRRPSGVLILKAKSDTHAEDLLRLLRTEGIEIIVGPVEEGATALAIRAPKALRKSEDHSS